MAAAPVSLDARDRIADVLEPAETLLWSASPIPARFAVSFKARASAIVGGVAFLASAAMFGLVLSGAPPESRFDSILPLLAPLLMALAMALAPLWAYLYAGRLLYAITDRRVVVVREGRVRRLRSYPLSGIALTDLKVRADGTGDVLFQLAPNAAGSVWEGLIGVPDAKTAETLLRGLAKTA